MTVKNIKPTADDVKAEARKQLNDELIKDAVVRYKTKLKQITDAEQIVKNLQLELKQIEDEIDHGFL